MFVLCLLHGGLLCNGYLLIPTICEAVVGMRIALNKSEREWGQGTEAERQRCEDGEVNKGKTKKGLVSGDRREKDRENERDNKRVRKKEFVERLEKIKKSFLPNLSFYFYYFASEIHTGHPPQPT